MYKNILIVYKIKLKRRQLLVKTLWNGYSMGCHPAPRASLPHGNETTESMERDRQEVSRRAFLQRLSVLGLAGAGGGALLSACGGGSEQDDASTTADTDVSCDDLSGLTDAQREQRRQVVESLNYVEASPNENQTCANCALYTPPTGDEPCGGCQLFPGPVNPNGYCTSWAPA